MVTGDEGGIQMSRRPGRTRRALRSLPGVVLAGVLIGAVGTAGGATPPAPETGHAAATVTLPRVTVVDASGATHAVELGTVGSSAVTDATLLASLGLTGTSVLGTALPSWQVDSAGGPVTGDQQVPIAAPGVSGGIDLVGYDVQAAATSAHAGLGSLTGTLTTTPVDLHVDLGQHGLDASATSTGSSAALALTVSGLHLSLGDLLPANVLAGLPLPTLLGLASAVDLTTPAGIDGVPAALTDLVTRLDDVTDAAADLTQARQALADLLASLPTTAAAQQALDDAESQLAADLTALQAAQDQLAADTATVQSLTAQVASLTTQLADPLLTPLQLLQLQSQLGAAQPQLTQATAAVAADQALITTLQQQVNTDQAAVAAAQQSLDALVATLAGNVQVADAQALVAQLTATLTGLVTQLTDAIGALPNIGTLLDQLRTALAAAPLLDVGTLGATLDASADDTAGSGAVSCTVTGATALGQPVPVGPCSALVARFADVRAAVAGVLAQLPASGVPAPVLDGLAPATTGAEAADTDVSTAGSAALTPLHLAVPATSLNAVTDSTTASLLTALGATEQQLAALGLPAVTSTLTGPLADLSTAAGALPTGAAVSGLRTVGLDVSLVGLQTSATYHRPAPTGTGGSVGTGNGGGAAGGSQGSPARSPSAPGAPSTPDGPRKPPADRTTEASPPPRLPFTGSDVATETALGLLLALVGGHVVVLGRRRRAI